MKNSVKCLAALLALALGLSGCGGASAVEENAASTAGSSGANGIVISTEAETGGFDPAGSVGRSYWAMHGSHFEGLLRYDEEGNITYQTAESYEANEDMSVWTFTLRENAMWSDGEPVTAADFVNTVQRALDPANQSPYADMLFYIRGAQAAYYGEAGADAVGVEAIDDRTLVFTLESPCTYFLQLLYLPVYMPTRPDITTNQNDGWDKDPAINVGNGALVITEYQPEQYFVLTPNEYYYNRDQVKVDTITYRFMDDMQARLAGYKTGEIDVIGNVPYYIAEEYAGQPDISQNQTITSLYSLFNLEVAPLDDPRVREALTIGINREELCLIVGEDKRPADHFVSMNMPSVSQSGKTFAEVAGSLFEEDVARAQQLLADAGYPDGEGFPTLTYIYPNTEQDANIAQVLQSQWKEYLGINVELSALEQQVYLSERRSGNFDIARMSWTADFSDPITYLAMCASYSGYNDSQIDDPAYDALLELSSTETDPAAREQLLIELECILISENFYLMPVVVVDYYNLVRPSISGVHTDSRGINDYRFISVE